MQLAVWLRVLAADDGPVVPAGARARNDAAGKVLGLVGAWAPGYVKKHAPCSLDDDDASEALQHLLTRCSLGKARFRGETEGEAHSYCMRILLNKARDLCRAKRRTRSLTRTNDDGDGEEMDVVGDTDIALDEVALREIATALELVEQVLHRLHRAKDVPGLVTSLRCHVDARLGATLEEQLETFGYVAGEARTKETFVKARNRVYQYRNRGRKAGVAALDALVGEGRLAAADVEHVRRILDGGAEVRATERATSEMS